MPKSDPPNQPKRGDPPGIPVAEPTELIPANTATSMPAQIFIVEDDPQVTSLIQVLLTRSGYRIAGTARAGDEASFAEAWEAMLASGIVPQARPALPDPLSAPPRHRGASGGAQPDTAAMTMKASGFKMLFFMVYSQFGK